VFTLTTSLPDESWCTSLLRKIRWNDDCVICPRCHSYNIKKEGQYRSYQKYFCKQCKRWFNDKTGTIFHYSHTPLKKWFLAMYLYFVLWPGCSIREISLEVVWYHIQDATGLSEQLWKSYCHHQYSLSTTKLDGITEGDEFYIKAGLKGRSYHDEILKSARKPRKRGLKPWRGRGTFYKDHPMITCIHQRENKMTYFDVPVHKSLLDIVCNRVQYGSTIFTDEYRAYDSLEEHHGFIHNKSVNHSQKEYASGIVHVNNCECRSNLYQLWIRKFMGVNKYNLQTYSKTFQFIHNNKRTKTREERFMEILCCHSS
jgi:transposase-like protein